MGFDNDFAWQLVHLRQIKMIVGPMLLVETPDEIDMKEAADLMVLSVKDKRIACRVRRPGYENYWAEFTIRSARDSGAKTEFAKICEGFGDWMFYGHAINDQGPGLSRWMVLDLGAFRMHLHDMRGHLNPAKKSNKDGTHFWAFDVRKFPPDPPLVIASSHEMEDEHANGLV